MKQISENFKRLAGLNLIFVIEIIILIIAAGSTEVIDGLDVLLVSEFFVFPYIIAIGLPWALIRIKSHQKVTTWNPTKHALKTALVLGIISFVVASIIQFIVELVWIVFDPEMSIETTDNLFFVRSLIFVIVGFCFLTFIPYLQMKKQLEENDVSIPDDAVLTGVTTGIVFSGVLIGGFLLFKNAMLKLEIFSIFEDIPMIPEFGITVDMLIISMIWGIFILTIYPIIRIIQLVVETFLNKKWINEYRNSNSKAAHKIV